MRRNLSVWITGFLVGVIATYELLWSEAIGQLAHEYHQTKGRKCSQP